MDTHMEMTFRRQAAAGNYEFLEEWIQFYVRKAVDCGETWLEEAVKIENILNEAITIKDAM